MTSEHETTTEIYDFRLRKPKAQDREHCMANFGLTVKHDSDGKRIELECEHQNGVVYVVRSEANWVCTDELLHVHSLAGFFRELCEIEDDRVYEAMQRWGIYFRPRPLASDSDSAH